MMKLARITAALLGLFALAACWTGELFHTAAEARPALPAGDYAATGALPDGPGRVRVSIRRDNMTMVVPISEDGEPDPGDAVVLGFAPLPGESGKFVAWLTEVDGRNLGGGGTVPYGLLVQEEGGAFRLIIPACTGSEVGATVSRDGETTACHFATRAALESALGRLGDGGQVIRLVPAPR